MDLFDTHEYRIRVEFAPAGYFWHFDVFYWSHNVYRRFMRDVRNQIKEYKEKEIVSWAAITPDKAVIARIIERAGGEFQYQKLTHRGTVAVYRIT